MESYIIFFAATGLGIFLTLFIRCFAIKQKIGSVPDKRMVHFGFIPHMGGLAIYLAGVLAILILFFWRDYYLKMFTLKYVGIFAGASLMLVTGIIDDVRGLRAQTKFILQLLAASIVIMTGCRIETIINPFGSPIDLGYFAIPITFLWIIGITNAINLLDGLDGLAAGVSAIAMAIFAVLAFQQQDWMTYNLCIAFIGAILGFLYFNYHPASIFMGDTGSLFLGFFLAALAVKGLQKSEGNISLLVPIIALTVPIGDTVLAFFRRLNKGQHPFSPDKDHLHHRLIFLGLSHRQAVHIIYMFSFLFGFAAYMIATESRLVGGMVLLLIFIIAVFSLYRLGYLEDQKIKTYTGEFSVIKVKKELAPLSMRRFWHKFLLILTDIVALNLSLLFTFWFRYHSGFFPKESVLFADYYLYSGVWLILTFTFIFFFMINGLYSMRWDVARFYQITRVSKVSILIMAIIFLITFDPNHIFSLSRLTLLFYMIMVIFFVNIGRMIIIQIEKKWHLLEYSQHNTLLIGADEKTMKLLEEVRSNPHLLYNIVGYVDNKKPKNGFEDIRYLGNYKILGKIIREYGVEEVIIATTEKSRDDVLDIIAAAQNLKVTFKIIPDMYDLISGHKTEEIIGHPLIRLFPEHMKPWQWILKRIFDLATGIGLIIILAPVFIAIIIIQLLSGIYPSFIIQDRVGKHRRIFGMLKFNTGKQEIGFGKWLQRSGFVNLPVLVNLIFGSVSLVGPAIEKPDIVSKYQSRISFYNRRFLIRPGIIGWKLPLTRNVTLKDHKDRFDKELFYLENMSLLFDLRLILRSVSDLVLFRK
jgi:UDP-GlcNAc:undecaprenyl-phosphate/decaprenyl-phosphate GlcNAc-1-phosphate transferase